MSHGESFLEVLRSRLDGSGWQETAWDDLALVDHHRRFLGGPERYLRHVLE